MVCPPEPDLFALRGMCSYVNDLGPQLAAQLVTKQEYLEKGSAYINSKFSSEW